MNFLKGEFNKQIKAIQYKLSQSMKNPSSIGIITISYVKVTIIEDTLEKGLVKCNQSSNT